jgi:hypothetical protein
MATGAMLDMVKLPSRLTGPAVAQTPNIGGNYSGMLGALHLKLHLKVSASADA